MTPSNPLSIGTVLNGLTSWFGGPHDSTAGPTTASGLPVSAGGIAVYNEATLGGYWRVTFPNGKTAVLKQTDIGPAPATGRLIDVSYASLPGIGYTEASFPTNGHVRAEYLGKPIGSSIPRERATSSTPSATSPATSTWTTPAGSPTSEEGLLGVGVKALVYLALLLAGAALLWLGTKTFLQPRPVSR